jgi:hypothetical protein
MSRLFMFVGIASAACSSSGPALDKASIESLGFGTPSGWARRDVSNAQRAMFEWTPSADDNDRKESLTIVRTDRPATAKSTPAQLQRMLGDAQRKSPRSSFSTPTHFITRHGFQGVRIEGEFLPPGRNARYHRIHAVLVDGTKLVNVIYTAKDPDRESFDAVLDSFFREGV